MSTVSVYVSVRHVQHESGTHSYLKHDAPLHRINCNAVHAQVGDEFDPSKEVMDAMEKKGFKVKKFKIDKRSFSSDFSMLYLECTARTFTS